MRLLSQLPVLLLTLLLLASCDDSLLPAPIVPDPPPPDTIIGPNGHILFSTVDPTDPWNLESAIYWTDTNQIPQLIEDDGLLLSKPGHDKMIYTIGQIVSPNQLVVTDHFGGNRQLISPVLTSDDEWVAFASAAINPQGDMIAFASEEFWSGKTRLYVMSIGEVTNDQPIPIDSEFANGTTPAWSADGTKLGYFSQAYDDINGGRLEVYGFKVVDVTQSPIEPRVVQFGEFQVKGAETIDWSPTKEEVVYCVDLELHGYDWESQALYTNAGVTSAAFSPDGKWIVYADAGKSQQQLHVMDWSTKLTTQLTATPFTLSSYPSWSPDGRWVIFSSVNTMSSEAVLEIVQVADPSIRRQLATGVGRAYWVRKALL